VYIEVDKMGEKVRNGQKGQVASSKYIVAEQKLLCIKRRISTTTGR
jgi:hypothetical protein